MATRRCMNAACGVTEPGGEWRRGWGLRSGGFAMLCVKCGLAYEQLAFCDIFHQKESGWRECSSCGKRLHCGCIASKSSFDLLDIGGVQCIGCMKNPEAPFMPSEVVQNFLSQHHQAVFAFSTRCSKENDTDTAVVSRACEMSTTTADSKIDVGAFVKGKGMSNVDVEQSESEIRSFGHIKWEQQSPDIGIASFSNRYQGPVVSSQISQLDEKDFVIDKSISESLAQACLSMSLGNTNQGSNMESCSSAERPLLALPMACSVAEGKDERKSLSFFQQLPRARFLAKPPKTSNRAFSDASRSALPYMRVARPPAEGRNQLLPRYWPRITDQELQQISGDSNSTIVPLFEKVLSASDAGRIGRLVLPKACAEAYFPHISQPEGVPLTIQDTKGKEWHFQFRFWPNNNSRMYVLEGVTPCIQSLQLQAGDTVTFSRIDPAGKLVMGYRKATNTVPLQQDSQISAIANGTFGNETLFSGVNENISTVSGYSGFLRSLKGAMDPYLSSQLEHMNASDEEISWHKGGMPNEGLQLQPLQKRSRNIGTKSRRFLMDTEDALELKLTWEEAQELLRPPPRAKPSIVTIEDHEVEEYEEPPVFGKKTIFTARSSGEQDQWVQCDDCLKWRRLPVDVLLLKWTCADNTWDPKRSSCSAPDELSHKEMQILLRQYEDLRKQRMSASFKQTSSELAASGLDALAAAAVLGDAGNQATIPYATTTKHPRHRPGCTCIVCIQPPSGKGPKHDPACTCNVCMTVKRRFKTLMMRKKKRQSEREEAEAHKKVAWGSKEEVEGSSSSPKGAQHLDPHQENEFGPESSKSIIEQLETSKGHIDLNCHPGSNEDSQTAPPRLSMMSLLQDAYRPLETYLKQNGLASLASEQVNQGSPSSFTVPQAPGESEGKAPDERHFASEEQEDGDDGDDGADMVTSDAS
ncbi:B3 domain-containing protein Os07g0679700 isoform X1 [Musa acuminata AAA Group]|uniref:B3 domain-containing protein Os07g0679700 isoform X1 n=2 Tax=Musa acuminata AAA Group TaxID=214697 RepID=UPI0031D37E23